MICKMFISSSDTCSSFNRILSNTLAELYNIKKDYYSGASGFDYLFKHRLTYWQAVYVDVLLDGRLDGYPMSLKDMWNDALNPKSGIQVDTNNLGGFKHHWKWLGKDGSWKNLIVRKLTYESDKKKGFNSRESRT